MLVTRRWTAGACAHLMFCLLATLLLLPSASSMTTTTTVTTSPSSTRKIDSLASISAGSSSRPWRWTSREPKEQQQRHRQQQEEEHGRSGGAKTKVWGFLSGLPKHQLVAVIVACALVDNCVGAHVPVGGLAVLVAKLLDRVPGPQE